MDTKAELPDVAETTHMEIEALTEASYVLETYNKEIYSDKHPGIARIVKSLRDKIILCEGHLEYLAKNLTKQK